MLDLERRWQEEEARGRVFVAPDASILTITVPTDVPPQVAWEFLTKPGQRMSWQPWVTEVEIEGATGGRRGPGSANHCMHGKDAVIEEILDWRPYDYVTDRTVLATPTGPLKLLHTIELEPTATGTTIHMRYAAPKVKRDRAPARQVADAYGDALRSSLPALVEQLDAALRGSRSGRRPRARADGAAAGRPPVRPGAAGDDRLNGGASDRALTRPRPYGSRPSRVIASAFTSAADGGAPSSTRSLKPKNVVPRRT